MTDTGSNLMTHSRMQSFRKCPRAHWLGYELGYRPSREADYFRFGAAVHWGLDQLAIGTDIELVYQGIRGNYSEYPAWCNTPDAMGDWDTECEKVIRLIGGYAWRWAEADAGVRIVESERMFKMPLINPETDRPSPIFELAGKRDKLIERDDKLGVREHKTTGDSIAPDSIYWSILKRDPQIGLYLDAAQKERADVRFIEYDVIRKPCIQRLEATPEDKRKYTKEGKLYANLRETAETVQEYGDRLTADIGERPDFYYARVTLERLDDDMVSLRSDIWGTQIMIQHCRRTGHWPRNASRDTCTFCCYDKICDTRDAELAAHVPSGFAKLTYLHPELKG